MSSIRLDKFDGMVRFVAGASKSMRGIVDSSDVAIALSSGDDGVDVSSTAKPGEAEAAMPSDSNAVATTLRIASRRFASRDGIGGMEGGSNASILDQ